MDVSQVSTHKPSPEDLAAHDFEIILKLIEEKVEPLGFNQFKRVMLALLKYPFSNSNIDFSHAKERELYNIGASFINAKHILMKAAMAKLEQALKDAELAKEGEQNGKSEQAEVAQSGRDLRVEEQA